MPKKILVLDRNEELAEQTRSAIGDGEDLEVVQCTRIGSTSHVHEHEGPFDLIIAGPSLATKAGLRRLAMLHRDCPDAAVIIGLKDRPDASLREIVQVGAVDLVELPAEDSVLRAAIKRGLAFAAGRTPSLPGATVALEASGAPPRTARVFTVCSATGGCGKTFYSTNLALFLAENSDARVALVDLDLQFGEITTALRLQPNYTIVDLLRGETDDSVDLADTIEDHMVKFEDKMWVLPAPKDPAQADEVTPADATRVLEALRKRFDYVIVDTPTALAETVLAAFDLSEHLFVMTTLDLPSVRNLAMFLQTLQKLRIGAENISLLMNKVETDVGIDVEQITKLFPQGFSATLPYAKEVSKSINTGMPVIASFPDAPIAKLITASAEQYLPPAAIEARQEQPAAKTAGTRTGRFFRRRSVVAAGGAR